jgi:uncharacterized membrane protein
MINIIPPEPGFRWRGTEITRLEAFSDAVFAFSVTLLVVSLEVPKTFRELMDAMRGFVSFGVCFALLANVWFSHMRFFRRYGLQTPWVVFLNCALLFFVLFYVYPLKFLFGAMLLGGGPGDASEARTLLIVYGSGFAAVFLVLALLYLYAWSKGAALALSPLELGRTRRSLLNHAAMVVIGLLSILLALILPLNRVGLAGNFYFIIPVYFTIAGMVFGRLEKLATHKLSLAAADAPPSTVSAQPRLPPER